MAKNYFFNSVVAIFLTAFIHIPVQAASGILTTEIRSAVERSHEIGLSANDNIKLITNNLPTISIKIPSGKWKLIQINGKTLDANDAFLILDDSGNGFHGNNGCNSITGSYTITKTQITFDKVAATLMMCEKEEQNLLEQEFMKLINLSSLTYDIADQVLNLYHGDKLVLMFGRTKQ